MHQEKRIIINRQILYGVMHRKVEKDMRTSIILRIKEMSELMNRLSQNYEN